jgi:hypothetical protein
MGGGASEAPGEWREIVKRPRQITWLFVAAACLLGTSCDSKNPLSDPGQSKPDPRLAGLWRSKDPDGGVEYYHVGGAGDKLPESVMQVVLVTHDKNGQLKDPGVMLMFPTVLGNTAFLNVGIDWSTNVRNSAVDGLKQEGWKPGVLEIYSIFKYRIEGDTLLLWLMAEDAKEQAIRSGKIKGDVPEKGKIGPSRFTDTMENVARFFTAAGESLFEKEPKRLERVK